MFVALDQSDTDTHFVVGSFWLPIDSVLHFESAVTELRLEQRYWREAHFYSLKKEERAFEFYKSLLTIALKEEYKSSFALLIADNDKEMRKAYFNGSYIQRDAAFMYSLISRRYRWWNIETSPYVIFDDLTHHQTAKNSDDEPEENVDNNHIKETREFLENYIEKKTECFAPCRSHISSAIQIADLVAGMTSLRWSINNGTQKKPNPAKLALLEWFEQTTKNDLGVQTLPSKMGFNIWRHRPKNSTPDRI